MNFPAAVSFIILAALFAGLFAAWPVMLLWGAIAGTYGLPTMGLGTALQVSWLAAILFKSSSSSSSSS